MAISFPSNPTNGQTYTVGSVTWTYDGVKWSGTASGIANLAGGSAGTLPYQSAASTTAQLAAGTSGYVLKANGAAAPTWTNSLSGLTETNSVLVSPVESWVTSATAATGTVNFDCSTQGVLYYTTAASANWTLNFRGNSTVALNTLLATGQTITVNFLNTNGSTAYYPSAFTIDGTSVSPKWSGGTAPAAGNASAVDIYSFAISKTGANTYNVFAAGPIKYA